jgi:class 3 adenylate cyclase
LHSYDLSSPRLIDSAISGYERACARWDLSGEKSRVAFAHLDLSVRYLETGDIDKFISHNTQLIEILESGALDISQVSDIERTIARNFLQIGAINEAILHFYRGIGAARAAHQRSMEAYCLGGLGVVYFNSGEMDSAYVNYQKAANLAMEANDSLLACMQTMNMGIVMVDKGNVLAKKHLEDALKWDPLYEHSNRSIIYGNLSRLALSESRFDDALIFGEKALEQSQFTFGTFAKLDALTRIAYVHIARKEFDKAEYYLQMEEAMLPPVGELDHKRELEGTYAELYKQSGRPELALKHFELYMQLKDSMVNDQNKKLLVRNQFQFEFDKKKILMDEEQKRKDDLAQTELRRQKVFRNTFLVGFSLVAIFALVFFRQRNKIKRGKKLSDELLLNILPEEVAEELKAKGSADAQLIDQVTVLFTDFKGFTQLSEKLSPKALIAEINECFSAFDRIMTKYGIEKIKTIGDAYMAAGGLPTPNSTHANDVVNAAVEIQQFMHDHKKSRAAAGELFFEIRIGVHTGPVVAGIVGVKKFQYDIWGDTVNTASCMESSGEAGKINISGTTFEIVRENFNCTHRGKIEAKNKGLIDMYFVEPHVKSAL